MRDGFNAANRGRKMDNYSCENVRVLEKPVQHKAKGGAANGKRWREDVAIQTPHP